MADFPWPIAETPARIRAFDEQMKRDEVIFGAIAWERLEQREKHHGDKEGTKSLTLMLTVLTEELGEVAQAILKEPLQGRAQVRTELLHVAAVAVQMLEHLDELPLGFEKEFGG